MGKPNVKSQEEQTENKVGNWSGSLRKKKAKIEEKQKQDSSRLGKSTIKFPAETKAQGTDIHPQLSAALYK